MPQSERALMYVSRAAKHSSTQVITRTAIVSSNDEVEQREVALSINEADLSKSSTSLLGPPKMRPAIARTDC